MGLRTPVIGIACAFLVAVTAAACGAAPADVAACSGDPDDPECASMIPAFTAIDCATAGAQWGEAVDRLAVDVINGPATANGEARSVRIRTALILPTTTLGQYLDAHGMLGSCTAADLLAAGEPAFSDELRAGAAAAVYDGQPVATWQQFMDEAARVLSVFDAPVESSAGQPEA